MPVRMYASYSKIVMGEHEYLQYSGLPSLIADKFGSPDGCFQQSNTVTPVPSRDRIGLGAGNDGAFGSTCTDQVQLTSKTKRNRVDI